MLCKNWSALFSEAISITGRVSVTATENSLKSDCSLISHWEPVCRQGCVVYVSLRHNMCFKLLLVLIENRPCKNRQPFFVWWTQPSLNGLHHTVLALPVAAVDGAAPSAEAYVSCVWLCAAVCASAGVERKAAFSSFTPATSPTNSSGLDCCSRCHPE